MTLRPDLSDVPREVLGTVGEMVDYYAEERPKFQVFLEAIGGMFDADTKLQAVIHSRRGRLKDPEHLRYKLVRKWRDAKKDGHQFDITKDNIFDRVTDLVGYRILHLHTTQFLKIHPVILELLDEYRFKLAEKPFARTWDDESRRFFSALGLETPTDKISLYTSVHYVFESNSKTRRYAELQVRTLAEELWGEVDHSWNYPDQTGLLPIREQIAALARSTSGCTRLVDSIFATGEDMLNQQAAARGGGGNE